MTEPAARARSSTAGLLVLAAGLFAAAMLAPATGHAGDIAGRFSQFSKTPVISPDHAPLDAFLKRYLRPARGLNLVAYATVSSADKARLKAYLAHLQATPVARLTRDQAFAFWVNLYNALTLDVVLDHYPVKSIRDIAISPGVFAKGPWGKKLVRVAGQTLSLDDIEHRILRKIWRDKRIHYAVNCASIGCPDLAPKAYRADGLDAMLDAAARGYINHPRAVALKGGGLYLSRIYDWYKKDFGSDADLLAHIRQYADSALRRKLAPVTGISGYAYDWTLNDAR